MGDLGAAARQALVLLVSGDPELWGIIGVSFRVSLLAVAIITPLALIAAFALAYARFPGRRPIVSTVHSLQAIPAVCVGLAVYLLLTRNGPLGDWRLLFTQRATGVGQMVLGFSLLLGLGHSALHAPDSPPWGTARTPGPSPSRAMWPGKRGGRFGF